MSDQFKKIQSLVSQTGDRCIVVDADGNPIYVMMGFHEFEKMLMDKIDVKGLTEEEFLEKINRDIAVWRSSQEDEAIEDWEINIGSKKDKEMSELSEKNEFPVAKDETEKKSQSEETYYFEPID